MDDISKKENLTVGDDDFQKEMEKVMEVNMNKEEVKKYFVENKANIITGMKEDKIFNFLIENAKIKEKK